MGYGHVHELRCINGPDVANSVMCQIVNGGRCVEVPTRVQMFSADCASVGARTRCFASLL